MLHTVCTLDFSRGIYDIHINIPKIGDAGARPLETETWSRGSVAAPLHLCCHVKFGHFKSNRTSVGLIMKISQKILTIASFLSRSLEVTGTNRDRSATYDFLLLINSNHGPISYRFRDKK